MAIRIDGNEPHVFPAVDDVDANPRFSGVEAILVTRIEGQATRVAIRLSADQAKKLGQLLTLAAGGRVDTTGA
jgi:hypothetical protein